MKEIFKSAATRASCGSGPFRDFYAALLAKVLLAISRCRTAALGGHIDEWTRCGHRIAGLFSIVIVGVY